MDNDELEAAVGVLQQQLQALGNNNQQVIQANNVAAGQLADARNRILAMEAAMANAGAPVNAGGGVFNAAGNAAGPGGAAAAAVRPPLNPRMPTLKYFGLDTEDWISFRASFVNYSRFSNFTDQQAKWGLLGCMKDAAFRAVSDVDHEDPNMNAEGLMDLYETMFMPPAASDIARTRYETAMQQPKEGILQWHGRLRMLCTRAYGVGGGHGVAALIRSFARGIRHKRIREHVLRCQPVTYEAALNDAQTEQAVMDSGSYIPGSDPGYMSSAGGHQHYGTANAHHGGEPMEIGALGAGKIQCHNCHLFGHFARDCDKPKKVATQGAAGGVARRGGRPPGAGRGGAWKGRGEPGKKQQNRRVINAINDALLDLEDGEDDYTEEEEPSEEEEGSNHHDDGGEENPDEKKDF